jgi:Holliday junction resolvase RusA-like endonuclease
VILTILVSGRPAPQGSKSLGGAGQLLEQSAYLPAWRRAVKIGTYEAYRLHGIEPQRLPLFAAGVPVTVELCTFYVTADQCRADGTDEPVGTPDIDKLLRATLDALGGQQQGSARVFADDAQVWRIRDLTKERATAERPPGALIIISDGRD